MSVESALEYLRRPRQYWVDIDVEIGPLQKNGSVRVTSRHIHWSGQVLQEFSSMWRNPYAVNTEYGWGVSLIHDVKDHTLYGLNITTLTEFQTIVQTYFGREVAQGRTDLAPGSDHTARIMSAIRDEMYGPRGPRVYGPTERGLFEIFAPNSSDAGREIAFLHMCYLCTGIMLPPLADFYARNAAARQLQASTRDQRDLVETLLPDVRWLDRSKRTLRLIDNTNRRFFARAYVDDKLAQVTVGIRDAVREYVSAHQDLETQFKRIFDVSDYVLPGVECDAPCPRTSC